MNEWEQIKKHIAGRLSNESYQNWLAKTSFHQLDGEVLRVSVPNDATRAWLEEAYSDLVSASVHELNLRIRRVAYELPGATIPDLRANNGHDGVVPELMFRSPDSHLNPRLTFDTFVVGSCNQFAHAAAKAVAAMPSRNYNPLFIYGGVGMGKTHLMHAIGRSLLDNFSGMKIVYTSSERFMNEMIQCIATQRMS